MMDDQLAKEFHELKRRRETPPPLIEMFDALLSLPRTERRTEAQAIRRDHGYGIETVGTQGRLIATGSWRGPAHSSHHWPRQLFSSDLSGSSAPGVAAVPSTWW
jgi:hypothetical protein